MTVTMCDCDNSGPPPRSAYGSGFLPVGNKCEVNVSVERRLRNDCYMMALLFRAPCKVPYRKKHRHIPPITIMRSFPLLCNLQFKALTAISPRG